MMDDKVARWLRVGLTLLGGLIAMLASYYKLDSRISLAEQRIEQETKGYFVLQAEISRRIERTENKVDDLNERLYRAEAADTTRRTR